MFTNVVRRTVVANRRFMSTTNPVLKQREQFFSRNNVGAEHATYQKKPGDLVVLTAAFTGLITGVGMALVGLGKITLGMK